MEGNSIAWENCGNPPPPLLLQNDFSSNPGQTHLRSSSYTNASRIYTSCVATLTYLLLFIGLNMWVGIAQSV